MLTLFLSFSFFPHLGREVLRMPRPSGFTDAELAAAAWRRNLKNGGANVEETEVRSHVSGYLA